MRGLVFVDMFRLHWNATIGRWHDDFFDSYRFFEIIYVFGESSCNPEYCERNQLARIADEIINKSIALFYKGNIFTDSAWFNIEFNSAGDMAIISTHSGDCSIFVWIRPVKELPKDD